MKKATIFIFSALLLGALTIFFSKCSTSSMEEFVAVEDVMERVDIEIMGSSTLNIHTENIQGDITNDLVQIDFIPPTSREISYHVKLSDDYILNIKMYNRDLMKPNGIVDVPFDLHVTQELDDKTQYVTMSVEGDLSKGKTSYTSLVEGNHGVFVNAFSIAEFDYFGNEILCRINYATLHNPENLDETVNVVGTFRVAITF